MVELCGLREGNQDIEGSECRGGGLKRGQVVGDFAAEFDKFLVFEGLGPVVRAKNFSFHFLEGGGDKALGIGHGLLALVVIGRFFGVGFGELDEVSEDVVKFNLERIDAGPFAL